jgi:hypothetical protein
MSKKLKSVATFEELKALHIQSLVESDGIDYSSVFKFVLADNETGEAYVEMNPSFEEKGALWRADILGDVLHFVEAAYNAALTEVSAPKE